MSSGTILSDTAKRLEGVKAGTLKLVGTDVETITRLQITCCRT